MMHNFYQLQKNKDKITNYTAIMTVYTVIITYINTKIKTGKFGADMKINLINDGPVTIIIEN